MTALHGQLAVCGIPRESVEDGLPLCAKSSQLRTELLVGHVLRVRLQFFRKCRSKARRQCPFGCHTSTHRESCHFQTCQSCVELLEYRAQFVCVAHVALLAGCVGSTHSLPQGGRRPHRAPSSQPPGRESRPPGPSMAPAGAVPGTARTRGRSFDSRHMPARTCGPG